MPQVVKGNSINKNYPILFHKQKQAVVSVRRLLPLSFTFEIKQYIIYPFFMQFSRMFTTDLLVVNLFSMSTSNAWHVPE